jgi:mevalonate kinase
VAAVIPSRVGVGRGKLILFGEHAAVYGYLAVGIPLDMRTRVELSPGTHGWSFPGLSANDAATVRGIFESMGAPHEGTTVRVASTVPRGVGFGSSAALCVALAAALSGAGLPYGRETWTLAHRAESLFHGTPSGIDTGLALLEGMRLFRPRPPDLPGEERLPDVTLHLVLGAVPRLSNTAALVASLRDRMRSGDATAHETVRELGRTAERARDAVTSGGEVARELGELADRAQRLLAALGLSTPAMDALLARGRSLGALGGKLSGAGGGGAFYLVAPSAEAARRIASGLGTEVPGTRAVLWSHGEACEDLE